MIRNHPSSLNLGKILATNYTRFMRKVFNFLFKVTLFAHSRHEGFLEIQRRECN